MITKIFKSSSVQKYFYNTSWMLFERVMRIISGVIVGIYVARYLGPDGFGTLNYILAIFSFVVVVTCLGMDSILVRELVSHPDNRASYMGTAFWMMFLAALLSYSAAAALLWSTNEVELIKIYSSIVMASVFFSPFLVIDYFFQAKVKAKYPAICKSITLVIVSVAKLYLVFAEAGLVWFVVLVVVEHAVLAIALIVMYLIKNESLEFVKIFSRADGKDMLVCVWPMVLSSVAILIYMRIDQVMIRNMLSLYEVGIYSVAVKLYEAWILIPYLITISLLPAMTKLKKEKKELYHKKLEHLFRLMFWLSIIAFILSVLFSEVVIALAFGEEYKRSSEVLNIIMCAAIFVSIGSVSTRYFSVEKMEKKIATRALIAAAVNIALNFILIPEYGIMGAAYATLACTFVANYLLDWFDKDLKELLKIKHQAFIGLSFK